jgi:HTH-type transcriptional regulator/antitoxin HipB
MEKKKFYTQEEVKDILIGKAQTPQRDLYEENLQIYLIGDAIKRVRQEKKLTQADLGKLVGVQKAQISRIENGNNLTFSTVIKLFKAMGVNANLVIENMGKVILC